MIGSLVGASTPPSASIVTATSEPGGPGARASGHPVRRPPRTCRPGGASRPRRPTPRTSCPPAPARGGDHERRVTRVGHDDPSVGALQRHRSAGGIREDREDRPLPVEVVRDGVAQSPIPSATAAAAAAAAPSTYVSRRRGRKGTTLPRSARACARMRSRSCAGGSGDSTAYAAPPRCPASWRARLGTRKWRWRS